MLIYYFVNNRKGAKNLISCASVLYRFNNFINFLFVLSIPHS